jgi:hypothetical protein
LIFAARQRACLETLDPYHPENYALAFSPHLRQHAHYRSVHVLVKAELSNDATISCDLLPMLT